MPPADSKFSTFQYRAKEVKMASILDKLQKNLPSIMGHHQRGAYRFQLGFDFGTSYSKCIYRNLGSKAFVFTFDLNGRKEFLLSSSIICKNNTFYINEGNQQYPEHGLWHIKMALADLAQKKFSSPTLSRINQKFGLQPNSQKQTEFVKAACLFYLSRALRAVRSGILVRNPDFGKHDQDDMYVTMAIPVSNLRDNDTKNAFEDILKKAWRIACQTGPLSTQTSCQEMVAALTQESDPLDNSCHVYPEVSANIQPFRVSSQSPGDSANIYLVTDTGSGTVDQCCFTLTSRQKTGELINYFSAQVFELGSGAIERRCSATENGSIEKWRRMKELKQVDPILQQVLNEIAKELNRKASATTFRQLVGQLHDFDTQTDDDKVKTPRNTPERAIRLHLYLIFTGGGDMDNPYHKAIINAVQELFEYPLKNEFTTNKSIWQDRVITISKPEDLELPKSCDDWMKRLYVAYGLSFKYEELPGIWLPNGKEVDQDGLSRQLCPYCKGKRSHCVHCNGFGWVY